MRTPGMGLPELTEDYRFLRAAGETYACIADRLGFTDRQYLARRVEQARQAGLPVDTQHEAPSALPAPIARQAACASVGEDPED